MTHLNTDTDLDRPDEVSSVIREAMGFAAADVGGNGVPAELNAQEQSS